MADIASTATNSTTTTTTATTTTVDNHNDDASIVDEELKRITTFDVNRKWTSQELSELL
jgi:hypothetical protein